MTRPNITPGPWHVSNLDQIWDETGDIKIAEICELPRVYIAGSMRPNSEQETANSKAIAAVPALLEALEAMLEAYAPYHQQTVDHRGNEESLHSSVKKARAALIAAGYQF